MKKGKISFKEFYNKLDKDVIVDIPVVLISTVVGLISLNYPKNEIIEFLSNFGYENVPEVLEHIYKTLIGLIGVEVGFFMGITPALDLKEKAENKLNDYFLVNGLSLDILDKEELEELQNNIKMLKEKKQVRCKNRIF